MRKPLFVVLSSVLVSALLAGPAAAHVSRIDTTLSINRSPTGVVDSGDRVLVFGKLRPHRCADRQLVRVFRASAGADELLGSDRLDGDGEYGVRVTANSDMNVYAKVGRKVIRRDYGHRHICRGDRSPSIHIEVA